MEIPEKSLEIPGGSSSHPWKCARPAWVGLWAGWSSGRHPLDAKGSLHTLGGRGGKSSPLRFWGASSLLLSPSFPLQDSNCSEQGPGRWHEDHKARFSPISKSDLTESRRGLGWKAPQSQSSSSPSGAQGGTWQSRSRALENLRSTGQASAPQGRKSPG